MNNTRYSVEKKEYKAVTIEDLEKRDPNTHIEISGIELSFEVSSLKKDTLDEKDNQLLDLYYRYLVDGRRDGYASPYIEAQLKDVLSLSEKFFKNASGNAFRVRMIQ